MKACPLFILGFVLLGLGVLTGLDLEPQAKAVQVKTANYQYCAPAPAQFVAYQPESRMDKPVMAIPKVNYQRNYYRGQQACYGTGCGGNFPIARAGLRVVTFPVRAWLAWAPLRRLCGSC